MRPGSSRDELQRRLPIPDVEPVGLTTYDAKDPDTRYPPDRAAKAAYRRAECADRADRRRRVRRFERLRRAVPTPNFERLAASGLQYTRFHTTALCSPTRSALLTGRNHHSVGMGNTAELATSAPGNSSIWPNTAAPLAKILNLNGYSTAQFGKSRSTVWETSPMGPYRQSPGSASTSTGSRRRRTIIPALSGTTPVEPETTPEEGYYLNDDLSSHAVKWIRQQRSLMPDKPFFASSAPRGHRATAHARRSGRRVQGPFRRRLGRPTRRRSRGRRSSGWSPPTAT